MKYLSLSRFENSFKYTTTHLDYKKTAFIATLGLIEPHIRHTLPSPLPTYSPNALVGLWSS